MARDDFAEERVDVCIVDNDRQEVADLAAVAVEDDDPVAMGAAGELKSRAVGCRLSAVGKKAWPRADR